MSSQYSIIREGRKGSHVYTVVLGESVWRVGLTPTSDGLEVKMHNLVSMYTHVSSSEIHVVAIQEAVVSMLEEEKRSCLERINNLLYEVNASSPLEFHFSLKQEDETAVFTCIRGIGKIKKGEVVRISPELTRTASTSTDKYHYPWEVSYLPWRNLKRFVQDNL